VVSKSTRAPEARPQTIFSCRTYGARTILGIGTQAFTAWAHVWHPALRAVRTAHKPVPVDVLVLDCAEHPCEN
jgi:hypothetical protein